MSDYKEFEGKDTKRVDFESYELELNDTEFKKNDTIYGRFKGVSKPIKNSLGTYRIAFSGEFRHVIGVLMFKRKETDKYRIMEDDY